MKGGIVRRLVVLLCAVLALGLLGGPATALINSEDLRDVASQLLGGRAHVYLPFTAVKSTGGGRFHFHQDNQYTRFDGPGLNTWFALERMDLTSKVSANGRIIHWAASVEPPENEKAPELMARGPSSKYPAATYSPTRSPVQYHRR